MSQVHEVVGRGEADAEDLFDMVLDSGGATDARFYVIGQNELIAPSVTEMKAWLMARGYCTPH